MAELADGLITYVYTEVMSKDGDHVKGCIVVESGCGEVGARLDLH
jgi:hypothetical protein